MSRCGTANQRNSVALYANSNINALTPYTYWARFLEVLVSYYAQILSEAVEEMSRDFQGNARGIFSSLAPLRWGSPKA